jgi:hypothetical protein
MFVNVDAELHQLLTRKYNKFLASGEGCVSFFNSIFRLVATKGVKFEWATGKPRNPGSGLEKLL